MSSSSDDKLANKADEVVMIEAPPSTLWGTIRRIGPGLIVAGSIVGSGELIATTKTGAEAGFWLLWLILIGCVIKVFCQVEFGRYSLVGGKTTIFGLNEVPGPDVTVSLNGPKSPSVRGNWIVWFWFLMWFASIGQLGGIVGGVGQALAISMPLTQAGREFNQFVDDKTQLTVKTAELGLVKKRRDHDAPVDNLHYEIAEIESRIATAEAAIVAEIGREQFEAQGNKPSTPPDEFIWATIIAIATSLILVWGRYGLIQSFSTIMVASFTLITIVNLVMLQSNPSWAVGWSDIVNGMTFRLPPATPGMPSTGLATALATFGIIGVGASELITYPYWCLEKGYARFTGPRDASAEWAERARGWMRVMKFDAWSSMFVYTFATIAFYLLGAAVLGRTGLNPGGNDLIRTLSVMYEPVFGSTAQTLFLFGAFAVLYSTYFVANASHARVFSDALRVLGFIESSDENRRRWIRFLSGFFPIFCLVFYIIIPAPAQLVLISGLMQALMLPMLAAAALYFRYLRSDDRITPGRAWDIFLWISAAGMLIAGVWALWSKLEPMFFPP